ncbi:hypothetical protein B7463_g11984, partial [Scytalidium lignicola]
MAESRIAEAIEYIQLHPHAKIAPIACSFDVPYYKLRVRLNGRNPLSSCGGHNKKLSKPQETALKDYMMLLYHSGTLGTIETLIQAANRLLYYSGINDTVSYKWAKRWIVRNKEYWKLIRPKPISVQRRQAHIQEDIKAHFEEFKRCSFRKTGLIPLNPEIVLRKVKLYQGKQTIKSDVLSNASSDAFEDIFDISNPSTPPQITWANWPTPFTLRTWKSGMEYVRAHTIESINRIEITPSVVHVQDKLGKAAETSMLRGALSTQRVFDLSLATERRKIQPDGNKIVQKYNKIYGRQALRQIEDDREEEARVVNMREARLTRPWRMKYKAIVSDLDKCRFELGGMKLEAKFAYWCFWRIADPHQIICSITISVHFITMLKPIETDFKEAAATISNTSPNDPIANSFAQYKQFALLRCSRAVANTAPPSTTAPIPTATVYPTKQKGSVFLINTSVKNHDLVLIRWVDSEGVVRTRNPLCDAASQGHSGSHTRLFEREMHRALDLLVNKNDIREHLLLNSATVEALRYYVSEEYSKFLAEVLANKLITFDMLVRIGRGPIFGEWMIKQLIFDAVMKSAIDFDKMVADNAVAATAHFIANNGMVTGRSDGLGYKEWKAEGEDRLKKYFDEIDTSTTSSNIFTLFNQIILQFATPASIGSSSVEDLITRAGLVYAIILQAATRAVEQLVRDTTAHAAKVSLDVSVIFAAITLGGSLAPSPYVALVVDSVEGVIQTLISNYANQPVNAVTAIATNLNDQFSNYILKPALAGDSVPGLFPENASSVAGSGSSSKGQAGGTPVKTGTGNGTSEADTSLATTTLTPAGKRRELGQLFESKFQYYVGMLDTVHTPMQKI